MNRLWKWYLPGYLFALPGTIVGLVLLAHYGCEKLVLREGVINVVVKRENLLGGQWVGAQTFGNVIFYKDGTQLDDPRLRVHEHTHVWQAMFFTWILMAVWYGLHYIFGRIAGFSHMDAYLKIYWEVHARRKDRVVDAHEWGAWS